jgi:hypothetical protein
LENAQAVEALPGIRHCSGSLFSAPGRVPLKGFSEGNLSG